MPHVFVLCKRILEILLDFFVSSEQRYLQKNSTKETGGNETDNQSVFFLKLLRDRRYWCRQQH